MSLTGPFTLRQGLDAGLSERVMRGPGYRRLFHGVYAPVELTPTVTVRARAALLVAPKGALLARHSAATLWGGVVPATPDLQLDIPPGSRLRVAGVEARVRLAPDAARHRGLPITSPTQTFLDLADLDLVDLVVLGDSLVRAGVVTPPQLVAAATAFRGRCARHLRRAAALVRVGVDSPMETRLRLLILLAGLPEPVVNHPLRDDAGRVRYRLDLSYPEWRIAIEYDGRQHAENTAQWRWDIQRREDLDADGWRLVVVLSGDLYRGPARTLERIRSAARAQGVSLPMRSDEWCRYFPQRD